MKRDTRIKDRRLELNMSQMELARLCRVSLTTIVKYENGCSVPRRENMERLQEVLGIKLGGE